MKQYWLPRDQLIDEFRKFMSGRNLIAAPKNKRFKIKPIHTYVLATLVNEKLSRFLSVPEIQIILNDELDPDHRSISSTLEKGINAIQYEMERFSDGAVWDRVILDSILVD